MGSSVVASSGWAQLGTLVEGIADVERQIARLRAQQAELVDELDRQIGSGFPDAAREELMVACKITAVQARRRLDTARALARRLAHTRDALRGGRIRFEHEAAMADATRELDRELAGLVETEVLCDARAVTAGQLGWRAREAAARLAPPTCLRPRPRIRRNRWSGSGTTTARSTSGCTYPPRRRRRVDLDWCRVSPYGSRRSAARDRTPRRRPGRPDPPRPR